MGWRTKRSSFFFLCFRTKCRARRTAVKSNYSKHIMATSWNVVRLRQVNSVKKASSFTLLTGQGVGLYSSILCTCIVRLSFRWSAATRMTDAAGDLAYSRRTKRRISIRDSNLSGIRKKNLSFGAIFKAL